MNDPNDLEPRLLSMERDIASLREDVAQARGESARALVLSSGADRDVSEVRAELRAHTGTLNALRQTQNDHYREFVEFRAEAREGFAKLHAGQEHITRLIEGISDK